MGQHQRVSQVARKVPQPPRRGGRHTHLREVSAYITHHWMSILSARMLARGFCGTDINTVPLPCIQTIHSKP